MYDGTISSYFCQAYPEILSGISLSHIKPYLLFYLQARQASRNICHGFDPVPVIAFQKCRYTLKDLICIEAAHNDGR